MIGLFLGAGFSKWAAQLPVASELFDFQIEPYNNRDKTRLDRIVRLKSAWDASNGACDSELFIREMIEASERTKRLVTWYVTRRLSQPFVGTMLGGTQALMIDDSRRFRHPGIVLTAQFLQSAPKLAGVITTNYDLLAEYGLGTIGFNYGVLGQELKGRGKNPWFPWQGLPVPVAGSVRLAKLHGSVSWTKDNMYTDGRCGVRGDALIVPPDGSKAIPRVLSHAWDLARAILADTSHLVLFGFGFNAYDVAVLKLLGTARPGSATLVDIDAKESAAGRIWPEANMRAVMPPSDGETVNGWWQSIRTRCSET